MTVFPGFPLGFGFLERPRTTPGRAPRRLIGGLRTGRRELGTWPSADSVLQQLIDALSKAAEEEPRAEEKGKMRPAIDVLAGMSRDIAVGPSRPVWGAEVRHCGILRRGSSRGELIGRPNRRRNRIPDRRAHRSNPDGTNSDSNGGTCNGGHGVPDQSTRPDLRWGTHRAPEVGSLRNPCRWNPTPALGGGANQPPALASAARSQGTPHRQPS
jgi:hypothetical protein